MASTTTSSARRAQAVSVQRLPPSSLADRRQPHGTQQAAFDDPVIAIYLISQAKTGLSSLALKRQLGVSYPTA